jgi:hypothetical protein
MFSKWSDTCLLELCFSYWLPLKKHIELRGSFYTVLLMYRWTFTEVAALFVPHLTLSGVQSVSSTVYVEILPLCCVLFFTWRSSTFFTKLSVTFLPWHSTYFVRYCKWIVFVQRKTFHTQPINLIFMKYSITELPYQLAEQIRWHKAWCLTCRTKLLFPCTDNKD